MSEEQNLNEPQNQQLNIAGVRLSYLTEAEKSVISLIEKGEPIVGKENTKKAVINWINMCLSDRIISN